MPTLMLFVLGFALLAVGAEVLVRGAVGVSNALRVPPVVAGLTVVAFATSAPELAVCVQASFAGQADIAVGNVVGSNIANVLLILGLSALAAPLVVSRRLVVLDVPLMIGASVLMFVLALDGSIGRVEGLLLFGGLIAYTVWLVRQGRRETAEESEAAGSPEPGKASLRTLVVSVGLVAAGLALLVLGADWLLEGAVLTARALGVDELVIGLTIVAVGTSLPELATSVVASLRGQRDIAAGNIVGSNLFNILAVLGLTSVVAPSGVAVSAAALRLDIPVMVAVAVACLPILYRGHSIVRWEGALFLFYYAAYVAYLVMAALESPFLPTYSSAMLGVVLPITAVTLAVLLVRYVRSGGEARVEETQAEVEVAS